MYLVDGTSLCYRFHFAINLSNSSGFPTGAVYGFYRILKKIISEQKPDFMGICFDVSRKTYRQEKYKDYKIQRPPLPDNLGVQFPIIKKLIKALGVRIVEKEGFEADDVIASLSKDAIKHKMQVVVVSSDKDLYQLLTDKEVSVYNYREEKFYQNKEFIKKYGFEPAYMIDYLSLAGDACDNIPGAKGIGKVTAAKLVKEFGHIDNVFKNLDKIRPKQAQKLRAGRKEIVLSRELVELSEPKLNLGADQLARAQPNKEQLIDIFSQMEFKIPKDGFFAGPELDLKVKKMLPLNLFKEKSAKQLIYFLDKDNLYIYMPADGFIYEQEVEKSQNLLADSCLEKVTFNLKKQMLEYRQIAFQGKSFDVEVASYLVDSSISDYSLTCLAALFLGEHYPKINPEFYPYFIGKLYKVLKERLREDGLEQLFYEIEMPLVEVLYKMQADGININLEKLDEAQQRVNKKIEEIKKIIFKRAQKKFNLNSPKQLQEVLFSELDIKPLKKTKTGYSTNEEVLKSLAPNYSIAKDILQYRELSKLKTTYLLPLSEKVTASGGKLFACFNQTGTQTGRLSSSSPNLQSIPAKGEFSSDLRRAFVSSYEDGFIVCADYSQIELRILAHLSGDENLIEAFRKNLDIHKFTASRLFETSLESVDDAQRNMAKKVNFGIVYGMSPYGLSKELGMDFDKAQEFIQNYFSRYRRVQTYIDKTISQVEKKGYVETIFKRRRALPQIHSSNPRLKEFAKRQAVNAPIQGSCADIIKLAMVKIHREIAKAGIPAKLIMQIHDELIFDTQKKATEELIPLMRNQMESCLSLSVPLKVNIKAGINWGQTESIEKE